MEPWLTMNVRSQLFDFLINMGATYLVLNTLVFWTFFWDYVSNWSVWRNPEKPREQPCTLQALLFQSQKEYPHHFWKRYRRAWGGNYGLMGGWGKQNQLHLYGSDSVLGPKFQTEMQYPLKEGTEHGIQPLLRVFLQYVSAPLPVSW